MSEEFRITPDQMRERAKQFREQADIFSDTIANMQSLIDALQVEWLGRSSEEFANQFATLKVETFVKVQELIGDIAGQLDGTATVYEEVEDELASKFKI